ncbi:MAG: putative toxin-antitoxin system toxin component, PIN family [Chitinophagia bacterium]|nr:putative toxin-antitoxin system toxin component, PIN family [Chitinophagia bacterium]
MKIVLDTNCFISCIGKQSPYRNVFDYFLSERYTLCVSTEILLEYEEIFLSKWGEAVTENLLTRLIRAKNLETVSVFFNFNAVNFDADDNKFADVYIASNADIIVSNDTKLLNLNMHPFPQFKVVTLQAFSKLLGTAQTL